MTFRRCRVCRFANIKVGAKFIIQEFTLKNFNFPNFGLVQAETMVHHLYQSDKLDRCLMVFPSKMTFSRNLYRWCCLYWPGTIDMSWNFFQVWSISKVYEISLNFVSTCNKLPNLTYFGFFVKFAVHKFFFHVIRSMIISEYHKNSVWNYFQVYKIIQKKRKSFRILVPI